MASRALSVPSCTSSPGIDPVNLPSSPSRRQILAGAAIVAALPSAAIAGSATLPSTAPPRRWDRLRQAFEAARVDVERYEASIYRPAMDRLAQMVGPEPKTSVRIVAKNGTSAMVRMGYAHEFGQLAFINAPAIERQHEHDAWRERSAKAECDAGWAAIDERMRALDDAEWGARQRLFAEPAPDGLALAYKLHLALSADEFWAGERAALAADAKRLA